VGEAHITENYNTQLMVKDHIWGQLYK